MKERYFIIGLFVLLLIVSLGAAACGSGATTTTAAALEPTTAATTATTAAQTATTAAQTETTAATTATTAAASGEPIKIGQITDLTGVEATTGTNMKTSLQLAFDAIGNQINGRPVQIIVGDGQDQASIAVDVAKKMVEQDHVVAIFGPNEVGEKMAVAGYIKQAGIPMILWSPSPPPIFKDNPWVIGSCGTTVAMPSIMADYLAHTMNLKTIDTLSQDNSAGHAFLDPLAGLFKQYGGTVAQQQWNPTPCSDFAPYLTTLKTADALVAWEAGADAIKLHTQYHELGIAKKMPLVGAFHGAFFDPWVFKALAPEVAAGSAGAPVPMEYSPDSQDPANLAFVKLATSAWGHPPADGSFSNAYQAAALFIEALKANGGDTSPKALVTAMLATKWDGPEGPAHFAAGDQAATRAYYIVKEVKNPDGSGYHYETLKTYTDVPPAGYVAK